MESFYRKQGGTRKLLAKEKGYFGPGPLLFEGKGIARIFIMQITSLVLIRKFHIVLQVTFLGRTDTAIKPWFDVVEGK